MPELIDVFRNSGIDAVRSQVQELPLDERLTELNSLLLKTYNEDKNLTGVREIFALAEEFARDAKTDDELSAYKRLCYNVAANHWRGWDEPGITVSPEEELSMKPYAQKNLELAIELKKPNAALFNAYWLVGAFEISSGDLESAKAAFNEAGCYVENEMDSQEGLMIRAYTALVSGGAGVEKLLSQLVDGEHGQFYVDQIRSTARVYGLAMS
ncbi:hypothetical protein QPK87_13500 [Kamptonema cortianum]|nr:hypothetical protein [Geitlerinema splendidum]MDK3157582.1 hypothetical protein [Kamptonema cortianum]